MTKAKNICTYILAIIILALSFGFFGVPKIGSRTFAAEIADVSSLFIRDYSIIATNKEKLFIYDSLDQKIKVQNFTSQENSTFDSVAATSVTGMAATANHLFVLNNESITIYDSETLDIVTLEDLSAATSYADFSKLTLFELSANEVLVLLTCNKEDNISLKILSVSFENNTIELFSDVKFGETFITQNLASGITTASLLTCDGTSASILLESGGHFYTFSSEKASSADVATFTTLSIGTDAINSALTQVNSKQIIIKVTESAIFYHEYIDGETTPALIGQSEFSDIDKISVYGDTLIVFRAGGDYNCESYNLSLSAEPPITITATLEHEFKNPDVDITLRDKADFAYLSVTEQTMCYQSPYTMNGTMLEEGTNVVLLSIPTADGKEFGYMYCLVVSEDTNILGYIESSKLETLESTTFDYTYAFVIEGTNMYSLPSNITGDQTGNSIEMKISMNDKVKILSTLNDANISGRKYLLVQVNNRVGFILRDRVSGKFVNFNLVLTNAYLVADVSVYKAADTNSEVIDTLSSGSRIRVTSTRRIDSNFMEVKYNNTDGEEVTGYIQTSAIVTDSWSMLQILGMVLVVINGIFLLIIIAARKKVNKD